MDALPDELHLNILRFLDPSEWRATKYSSYRLTSRHFARIGAQMMFESFQFGPSDVTLQRIHDVSSSDLMRCVKTLDYDGEVRGSDGPMASTSIETRIRVFTQAVTSFPAWDNLGALHLPRELFWDDNYTTELGEACKHAKSLDIHFDPSPGQTEHHRFEQNLSHFLSKLAGLNTLCLTLDQETDWRRSPLYMDRFLPRDHAWSRLRLLQLEYMAATGPQLIALFDAHSATLKCFHLKGITISHPDGEEYECEQWQREWRVKAWQSVFEKLSAMKVLKHGELTQGRIHDRCESKWTVKRECDGVDVDITTDLVKWLEDGDIDEFGIFD